MSQDYSVRKFTHLKGLKGISDSQLEQHFKLYEGYVKNTNLLQKQISELMANSENDSLAFAELNRRLPFEQNGMVLHEYYFENMAPSDNSPPPSDTLIKALEKNFGSLENYRKELLSLAKMRGVGWVLTLQDPSTGWLWNRWISLHQDGNIASYRPILVLDVWEHAWTVDYKPTERTKYLDAWIDNLNWKALESRLIPGYQPSK